MWSHDLASSNNRRLWVPFPKFTKGQSAEKHLDRIHNNYHKHCAIVVSDKSHEQRHLGVEWGQDNDWRFWISCANESQGCYPRAYQPHWQRTWAQRLSDRDCKTFLKPPSEINQSKKKIKQGLARQGHTPAVQSLSSVSRTDSRKTSSVWPYPYPTLHSMPHTTTRNTTYKF